MYDPETGRFLQPDRVHNETAGIDSYDRYSYVSGNPVNFTDPTGESAVSQSVLHIKKMNVGQSLERMAFISKERANWLGNRFKLRTFNIDQMKIAAQELMWESYCVASGGETSYCTLTALGMGSGYTRHEKLHHKRRQLSYGVPRQAKIHIGIHANTRYFLKDLSNDFYKITSFLDPDSQQGIEKCFESEDLSAECILMAIITAKAQSNPTNVNGG